MVIMMMGALWVHTESQQERREGFCYANFCVIDWHEWTFSDIYRD